MRARELLWGDVDVPPHKHTSTVKSMFDRKGRSIPTILSELPPYVPPSSPRLYSVSGQGHAQNEPPSRSPRTAAAPRRIIPRRSATAPNSARELRRPTFDSFQLARGTTTVPTRPVPLPPLDHAQLTQYDSLARGTSTAGARIKSEVYMLRTRSGPYSFMPPTQHPQLYTQHELEPEPQWPSMPPRPEPRAPEPNILTQRTTQRDEPWPQQLFDAPTRTTRMASATSRARHADYGANAIGIAPAVPSISSATWYLERGETFPLEKASAAATSTCITRASTAAAPDNFTIRRHDRFSATQMAMACGYGNDVLWAAELWDRRHCERLANSRQAALETARDYGVDTERRMLDAIVALASNRLSNRLVPPTARRPSTSMPSSAMPSASKAVDQGAQSSIWAPRAAWCDSRALYDTDKVRQMVFEQDWAQAYELGIHDLMLHVLDEAVVGREHSREHGSTMPIPGKVSEVRHVFQTNHELCVQLFAYYAAEGGSLGSTIQLHGWRHFITDAQLSSNQKAFCRPSDYDLVFVYAKATKKRGHRAASVSDSVEEPPVVDTKNLGEFALSRVEFLIALMLLAIKSCNGRADGRADTLDVSDALDNLFRLKLEPRLRKYLPSQALFRRCFAYSPEVNTVLLQYASPLRGLFACIGGPSAATNLSKASLSPDVMEAARLSRISGTPLLGREGFLRLLHVVGLIEADLSEHTAMLCFAWSRMVVVDARSVQGQLMEAHLPFEGFLETLCHLCLLKALPTDSQLVVANHTDAGSFLIELQRLDKEAYQQFLLSLRTPWGEGAYRDGFGCHRLVDLSQDPSKSGADVSGVLVDRNFMPRRLEHLIHLVFRRIEVACGLVNTGVVPCTVELSADQLASWWRKSVLEFVEKGPS